MTHFTDDQLLGAKFALRDAVEHTAIAFALSYGDEGNEARSDYHCRQLVERLTRVAGILGYRLIPIAPDAAREPELWPEGISDGLVSACADCGEVPRFDYGVADEFWARHVTGEAKLGVVCLPCLDRRCGGVGLADALTDIQWTGTGHTVVLKPVFKHLYTPNAASEPGGASEAGAGDCTTTQSPAASPYDGAS